MFSYATYKLVHFVGIASIFLALGALIANALLGNGKEALRGKGLRLIMATHGLGMFLVLLGGFGMMARLKLGMETGWIHAKLGLWILLGASVVIPTRIPAAAKLLWFVLPFFLALAAWVAGGI